MGSAELSLLSTTCTLTHECRLCGRYWDFTMSRRWDSHWKKHGKPGPSPFAASPSHRDQWQAQLGGLKQKAAYRRLQQQAKQQAQEADLHWTQQEQQQQQQQHQHQQHSEAEQQSEVQQHQNTQQQATQQQQDQQEVQHAVNTSHSPQALHSNSDQAPVGVNEVHGPPTEMHIANASSGTGRHSSHQSVHHKGAAQPADAFRERTHQLLGQVHACRAQMARRVGSHTAHWPNQLNDILCYALGQFQPDPAATRANHTAQTHGMPDSASHTPSAMPVDIAVAHPSVKAASHGSPAHRQPPNGEQMCQGASVSLSDGQTQAAISEDQMCQGGSVSSSEGRAQGANGVDLQDLSVQHEVKTFDRSTASQAAFQTQHSHVQSQLAGLKRRAARKQDS